MSFRSALSLTLAVTSTAYACGSEPTGQRAGVKTERRTLIPDRLVLLPRATGIQRSDEYEGVLKYRLDEPYPAESALTMLGKNLEENGWTASQEDILNPSGTTAVRKWGVVEIEGRVFYTWTGYWKDRVGDILEVNVSYPTRRERGEIDVLPPAELQIIAFSRATADAFQKALK